MEIAVHGDAKEGSAAIIPADPSRHRQTRRRRDEKNPGLRRDSKQFFMELEEESLPVNRSMRMRARRLRIPGEQGAQQFADAMQHGHQLGTQPLAGNAEFMQELVIDALNFVRSHFVGLFVEINIILFHDVRPWLMRCNIDCQQFNTSLKKDNTDIGNNFDENYSIMHPWIAPLK
jgi:hypothetical protein